MAEIEKMTVNVDIAVARKSAGWFYVMYRVVFSGLLGLSCIAIVADWVTPTHDGNRPQDHLILALLLCKAIYDESVRR